MNLPVGLVAALRQRGWEAEHWIELGEPDANDSTIMQYAVAHGYVVVSHDLDFSALLASTQAQSPSVIQLRVQDVLAPSFLDGLVAALIRFAPYLEQGALVVVEPARSRARVLPLIGQD